MNPTTTARIPFSALPKELLAPMMALNEAISTAVPGPLKSLMRLRVSQINGCAYCVDMHFKECTKAGLAVSKLALVPFWAESPAFDEDERQGLRMVEALAPGVTLKQRESALDAAMDHFGAERFSEHAFNIAQIHAWNALMRLIQNEPGHYRTA